MFKRPLLLAALATAFGCGSSTSSSTGPSHHPDQPVGLDSISAAELRSHVELLASDEFEGRATLEPGYEKAADYLVKEFKSYGLRPLPGAGSFKVPYTLDRYAYDHQGTHLALHKEGTTQAVAMGTQAKPFYFSDETELTDADVVFAGYGITAPEVDYDDYSDLDVKDKWVLILRHAPGYTDPKSLFYACTKEEKECEAIDKERKAALPAGAELPNLSRHAGFTTKAMNAQAHGAKGMLLVTGPATQSGPDDFELPSRLRVPLTEEEKAKAKAAEEARKKRMEEMMKRRAEAQANAEAEKAAATPKGKGKSKGKAKPKVKGAKGKAKGFAKGAKGAAKLKPAAPTCRLVYLPGGHSCSSKAPVAPTLPKPTGKETLVAMHIAQELATQLIASTGKSLEELQTAVDAGAKNAEFAIDLKVSGGVKQSKEPEKVQADNVIAYLEGSDPQLKQEWIVIGGHFDHLGAGHTRGSLERGKLDETVDNIHNGADDNASGTSAVLELAQAFASLPKAPKRSVLFMGFSAEERGLLGSEALVKFGDLPLDRIVFMLNLDMIGRNSDQPIEFVGGDFATEVRGISTDIANQLGISIATSGDNEVKSFDSGLGLTFGNYSAASDHHSFFKREIPVAFFFTGLHEDYHRVSDHANKLDYPRMETITKLAYSLVERLSMGEVTPVFKHKLMWLGASVHAAPAGESAAATVTEVEADSRAAKAGLVNGDIITQLDGVALEDAKLAGRTLRDIDPGKAIKLTIDRAGQTSEVELTRAKMGYLGVQPGQVKDEVKKALGIRDAEGVLLRDVVEKGPAEASGLKAGDIVIRIAGRPLNPGNLSRELARIGAGEKVELQLIRDKMPMKLTITLGERPKRF